MTTATKPRLTFAIAHYDRWVPLLDGTARAEEFDLDVRAFPHNSGSERHERMLRDGAYDVAELSLSSYLMACERHPPLTAIPMFPRRLFSQSQIWINVTSTEFGAMIKRQFDVLYREGAQSGRVMAIADHPYLSGVPHRIAPFAEALEYICKHDHVWLATGNEIARHFVDTARAEA